MASPAALHETCMDSYFVEILHFLRSGYGRILNTFDAEVHARTSKLVFGIACCSTQLYDHDLDLPPVDIMHSRLYFPTSAF